MLIFERVYSLAVVRACLPWGCTMGLHCLPAPLLA